jgi:tyrosine-protein phosphatase SIW14
MRKLGKQFIRLLPPILLCLVVTIAQDSPSYSELPNFQQVNDKLYRGGQPKPGGLQRLKQLGVKTVINLRDDDDRAGKEGVEAQSAGLRYFNIPLPGFGQPADSAVDQALALIEAADNQPVFVHCHRGADRTGVIIAIYRIEQDGWTSEQAKAEAKRFGLGFWQVSMKNYIRDYYKRRHERRPTTRQPFAAKPR